MPQQQTVLRVKTNIPGTISGTTKFEVLDLYNDVPIKINRSYAELQDISKKNSDYSIGISLPGSKKNNRFFESYYDVDTKSLFFNANNKTLCDVLVNDETYFSGYLRLNSVKIMDGSVEYNVTLYSTIGNLFGDIGNKLLKDLPFNDPEYTFNHEFNVGNCTINWFKSNFGKDQEQPSPFFYPIIHNGYEYSGNTVNVSGGTIAERTSLYTSSIVGSFANRATAIAAGAKGFRINMPGEGLINNQLKPALSIWNLIKLMFKENGYSIKSDFFNTPWMKTLYMYGYFSSANTKFTYDLQTIEEQPIENITLLIAAADGDPTKISIIVTKTGTGVPCYCTSPIGMIVISNAFVGFNGYLDAFTTGITFNGTSIIYKEADIPFCTNNVDCTLRYYPTPVNEPVLFQDGDEVNFSKVIDENIKQIDVLSSLAKKFNLVFVPDPDVPNQIIIEPYNYYIGTGNIYDWTDKLSYDKGFTIEPALNYVESNLILTDKDDGDYGNKEFKARNNRIYGQNNQYNLTDFKSQEKKIETIFSPEVLRVWDSQNPQDLQLPNGNIKLPLGIGYAESSTTSDSGGSEVINYLYKGAKTKPKLIWNLGPGNLFFDTLGEVYSDTAGYKTFEIDIRRSNGTVLLPAIPFSAAAIISHTMPIGLRDDQKINNDSLCLLFQSETPTVSELGVATFNVYTKNDAYSTFYANRVNNLYSPNTRFLKGEFYLTLSDYKNLKANDIIKINDQFFTWNKIDNYNLNEVELTKVELVQANFNPNTYTTRYFKYFYCQNPGTVYKLKTDFTNPSMLNTNYGWSVWYDYNMGTIRNSGVLNPTGATSMFYDQDYTGTTEHYVPYTIVEITEDDYNTGGFIDWKYDGFADWLFGQTGDSAGGFSYFSMPNFWSNSGSTLTGLNLFTGCSACYSAITANNIVTGSTSNHGVIPTPTPVPTSTPTPTPIPTSPELMRGSLLITFDEFPNYSNLDNIIVTVNGQIRQIQYSNIDNLYSTYIYSGDSVTLTTTDYNDFNVIRRDYTTDDQGGDIGIRDVFITGNTNSLSISFTATTVSTDYNFEHRINATTTPNNANILTEDSKDILTEDNKEIITEQNI